MKVIHVCAIGFTAKNLLLPQCQFLKNLGYDVGFVFSPDPIADELRSIGFEVKEIYIPRNISLLDTASICQLVSYFKKVKPDIVHTHTSKGGAVGRVAARLAGVRHIVHTIHGFPFIAGQNPIKYWSYLLMEKLAARLTDLLLSQSEEDVELARNLSIRARLGPPLLIGNGIDLERFNRDRFDEDERRAIEDALGIRQGPVITMVARLTMEKGYAEMVRALGRNRDRNWTALFVGPDDGDRHIIEEMLREVGLEHKVKLLGQRDDVDKILAITDVFVLPSYREGVPRSVIEAQAMGIPAIVTDIRGCREIVIDGKTGILVPPRNDISLAQAIADLLDNPDKRLYMGLEGAERMRAHFDERCVFRRIQQAYETMLLS